MKGKTVIRAVSVLGFSAVAVAAAFLGLQAADTDEHVADIVPAAASVELAPNGAISIPASPVSLDGTPKATAPAAQTRGLTARTAQSVSNKCQVPNGSVCYVRAKPVGSTCNCPGVSASGVIVD